MSDYIKRILAKAEFTGNFRNEYPTALIHALIDGIPAADVVEVVRCADCQSIQCNMRQDGYLPNGVPEYECRHWCGAVDPTDFCSYGRRRSE